MNRLIAFVLFSVTLPVTIIIYLLIRIDSKGPVILKQPRVGRDKKEFICLKFRTMHNDTPSVGSHLVNSDSITRVGKFLRVSKLDELPQLINIIRRDMNFIGYRPCLPIQEQVISERDLRTVFKYTPGITGLAQIKKIDMSTPQALAEADKHYYENQCLKLNISIIVATVCGSGWGDQVKS